MRSYLYPANFTPAEEGGVVVTFPDIPEAITQGETPSECVEQAADALEEAIIGRMNTGTDLPLPSGHEPGQFLIPVPAQTAFKAALYEEIRSQSVSKVQLAARLGVDEKKFADFSILTILLSFRELQRFLNAWESILSLACRTMKQSLPAIKVPQLMA